MTDDELKSIVSNFGSIVDKFAQKLDGFSSILEKDSSARNSGSKAKKKPSSEKSVEEATDNFTKAAQRLTKSALLTNDKYRKLQEEQIKLEQEMKSADKVQKMNLGKKRKAIEKQLKQMYEEEESRRTFSDTFAELNSTFDLEAKTQKGHINKISVLQTQREQLEELANKAKTNEEKAQIKHAIRAKDIKILEEQEAIAKSKTESGGIKDRAKQLAQEKAFAAQRKKLQKIQEQEDLAESKRKSAANKRQAALDAERLNNQEEANRLLKEADEEEAEAERAEETAEKLESNTTFGAGKAVTDALKFVRDIVGVSKIDKNLEDIVSHRTKTMARLQGFGGDEYDYNRISNIVEQTLGGNPYVKTSEYLSNLDKAVSAGIAYNVEQRTFLATISDEISATFDAFNTELLRLIKLQQADSTAARLGMEAAIQKGLNSMFSDSSYMTNLYQTVSGSLLGAESLMSRDDAVEFEYAIQKWLGALYSLGLSDSSVNNIASAVNSLATGDVTSLSSNSSMQTLLAMSAQRANVDFAGALVDGLNAADINSLMKSMVEYLQQIAKDSGNNVVKSAYKDLYGFSLADMQAISGLKANEIKDIFNQSMTYSDASSSFQSQVNSISKRLSTAEMINNVIDNFRYGIAGDIAGNPGEYLLWSLANTITDATGGIHIPAAFAAGFGLDLSSFTIEGLAQTAMVGISALSQVGNLLQLIGIGDSMIDDFLDNNTWKSTETTSRGGWIGRTEGFDRQTSQSKYVGSSSSEDLQNSTLSGAVEDSKDTTDIINADTDQPEHTFDDFYNAVFVDMTTIPVSLESIGKNGDEQLGLIIETLMHLDDLAESVFDVNIVSNERPVTTELSTVGIESTNTFRSLLIDEVAKVIANEIKENSLGFDKMSRGETVASVLRKLSSGDIEVKVDRLLGASTPRGFVREMAFLI